MKKYLVLAALFLIAIIMLLQLKTKRTNTTLHTPKTMEELKIGKEITKDLTLPPTTQASLPPYNLPSISQTSSPTYTGATEYDNTFKDIISDYGKKWGPTQNKNKKAAFTKEENDTIIKLMKDYLVCEAIAAKNPSKCDIFTPLKKDCIKTYYEYQFLEFFIGANKNEEDCKKYIDILKMNPKDDEMGLLSLKVSSDKLCSEIKNDIREICDRLFINTLERKHCYNVFPKDIIKSCPLHSREVCTNAYENAKKTGEYNCELFEESNRERCEIRKMGINICVEKLNRLIITYTELKEKKRAEGEEEERKILENEIIKNAKKAAEEAKKFKGRKNVDEE